MAAAACVAVGLAPLATAQERRPPADEHVET